MSFYMRILNRTEKNRRFLFLAAVFAVCTAAMLTVLMMPQKQVVCKGEADFKQFGLQSGKAVDLCGEWEFFEQKFIATELDEEQVFGKFVRVPSYMPRKNAGMFNWGSYRVKLKNCPPQFDVSVSLKGMPAAYRIYLNGKCIEKSGVVSSNPDALKVSRDTSIRTTITLQSSECDLIIETAGYLLPGLSFTPRIQEESVWSEQYDRYHTWMILLLGMHMLFLCSYLLQLKITPDSGYSRSVFLVLFLLAIRMIYSDAAFSAVIGGTLKYYDLILFSVCVMESLVWEFLLKNGYKKDRQKKDFGIREGILITGVIVMSLAAFEGILSWKLTMDVGVWLVLLIRFAGYRKKEEISGEDMIWEIGILLLYTGIVLSDFAHIGMLPYSGGIFMLVGVIAFDLSVNVIDRWRMNKIQQRALEAAKIEQKLQEARLELALHQIKPHFLQNALMSIKVLCRTRPKEAEQAVYDFAVFLRGNMNALESAEMILFREECKTIERYLHIEKMRFGERLQVQWDLQEEKFQIPPLTIQPLVENAVCHGICQKMEGGTVQIRSFRKNGEIDEMQLEIHTFGRFDLFLNGHAIDFSSRKAKELLALLVARRGGIVEMEFAVDLLWEEEPFSEQVKGRFRKAVMNLKNTLRDHGLLWMLHSERGRMYLETKGVSCDYYELMEGQIHAAEKFSDEFMAQYSWSEAFLPVLERQAGIVMSNYSN